MKFLKQLLIALAAVIGTLAVIGLLLPATARVERAIHVAAPLAQLFPLIDDLRGFNRWSPWAGIDPDARYTFSDPSAGRGAEMRWNSDHPNVGSGRMTIIESVPDERVEMELDFGPKGRADSWLQLEAEGGGTRVTWGFGRDFGNNLIGRYFGLMLDGLIGGEFEKGLRNLRELAEGGEPAEK